MIIIYFSDVSSPYDTSIHFRIFKNRPCQTFKRAQNNEVIQSSRHKIPQLNFSVANSALSSFLKIFLPESCKHWNIACEIIILMVFLNNFSLWVITMTFFHSKSILAIEESIFYSIYEYFNPRKPCRHSSFWQFFRFVMIESVCFFNMENAIFVFTFALALSDIDVNRAIHFLFPWRNSFTIYVKPIVGSVIAKVSRSPQLESKFDFSPWKQPIKKHFLLLLTDHVS